MVVRGPVYCMTFRHYVFQIPLIMPSKVSVVKCQDRIDRRSGYALADSISTGAAVPTVYRGLLQPGLEVKSQIPELCYCYYIQFKVMLDGFIVISFS